jgi:hypothetical protein
MTKVNRTHFGLAQSNSGQTAGHLSRDPTKKPNKEYFSGDVGMLAGEDTRRTPSPRPRTEA